MIHRRLALVLLPVFGLAGCRRAAGKADASYEKARSLYQKLYAAEFDDAYGDPKMDAVVALLTQVDPDSIDSGAAQSMLGGIQHGREVYAGQKPAREKLAAAAAAPPPMPNIDPIKVLAASAKILAASAKSDLADAGPPPDSFGPGAAIAYINRSTGGCLVSGEPFMERVTNKTGNVYRLSSAPQCGQLLPGFVNQAVLVVDGAVYRRIDASTVPPPQAQRAPPDAPPPASGAAPVAAPANSAAPSADPAPAGPPAWPDAGP